jgi:predicted MFS family arabinose efflux permease
MDRMALSVLAPSIQRDLGLSDAKLGLLSGFSFALFYAVCGIPAARWADRGVRKHVLTLALVTWSLMTALSGAAQNFWHMFLARVGIGAGEAGGLAPAQSMICDYVPLRRRSGVFAIHTTGLYAGMMVGMGLAGGLGEIIGWRWTFVVLGLPGMLLAVLVGLTLREPTRGFFDAQKHEGICLSFVETVVILWRCRTYRLLLVWGALGGFVLYGLSQWWPSYYARLYGLRISWVGAYLGLAIGVGSGVGMLLGGLLADRAAQRDVRLPLVLCSGAAALALPAALASLFVRSALGSMVLVALVGLFWSVSNGPAIAALYSVVNARQRAMAGAVNTLFTSVLGFGLGPLCVGLLSDALAPSLGRESLRYALLAPICLVPAMVFILYAAAKSLPSDLLALRPTSTAATTRCEGGLITSEVNNSQEKASSYQHDL